MAESSTTKETKVNTAVPTAAQGDHDRVAMLSLHPDGSPAQFKPEFIGDKEFAEEATKRQFAEQAVSAVDSAERTVSTPEVAEDPEVVALKEKHDAAQEKAEAAATKAVNALFKD